MVTELDTSKQDNPSLKKGRVTNVTLDGPNRFASVMLVSKCIGVPDGTHITFSLDDWHGRFPPRKNQLVVLEEVDLFDKGWRALWAGPIQMKNAELELEGRTR